MHLCLRLLPHRLLHRSTVQAGRPEDIGRLMDDMDAADLLADGVVPSLCKPAHDCCKQDAAKEDGVEVDVVMHNSMIKVGRCISATKVEA